MQDLVKTAEDLVTNNKGILAADQSPPSAKKLLDIAGVESNEENRRRYREILFTSQNISEHIGGIILHDETIRQEIDGKPIPQYLSEKGVMPGIKVDLGKVDIPNFEGEKVTEGLDGLRDRLKEYKDMGAKFTKWRAVYTVGNGKPSRIAIESNCHNLALYASFAQEAGMVPIVEPEVLMAGDHTIEETAKATATVLEFLFSELFDHKVVLEATLLKTNMIVSGSDNPKQINPEEIAEWTIKVMKEAVSVAVPSVVFLSGGLSPKVSTQFLDKINEMGPHPWELNFSFGRALQEPVLEVWQGKDENIEAAQQVFLKRARLNSLALRGEYDKKMEEQ